MRVWLKNIIWTHYSHQSKVTGPLWAGWHSAAPPAGRCVEGHPVMFPSRAPGRLSKFCAESCSTSRSSRESTPQYVYILYTLYVFILYTPYRTHSTHLNYTIVHTHIHSVNVHRHTYRFICTHYSLSRFKCFYWHRKCSWTLPQHMK